MLVLCAFWGWLAQIAHLAVFFPAFAVPCVTLVKRGGDMLIAIAMIAILVTACMVGFLLVLGNYDHTFNDPRALVLYSVRAMMGDFDFEVFEGSQHRHTVPIFIACYSVIIVYVLMSIFVAILSEAFADVTEQRLLDSQTETAKGLIVEKRASPPRAPDGVGVGASDASAAGARVTSAMEEAAPSGSTLGWGGLMSVVRVATRSTHAHDADASAAMTKERQRRQMRSLARAESAQRVLKGGTTLNARELLQAKMHARFEALELSMSTFERRISHQLERQTELLENALTARSMPAVAPVAAATGGGDRVASDGEDLPDMK